MFKNLNETNILQTLCAANAGADSEWLIINQKKAGHARFLNVKMILSVS